MSLILFNGPPRSGKDRGAEIVKKSMPQCHHMKLAQPLKDAVHKLLGLSPAQCHMFEDFKDEPYPEFNDMSPREIYIDMSEEFAKPRFGNDVFGKVMINRMSNVMSNNVVLSDVGFDDEVRCLWSQKVKGKVYCIQLERKGCSFATDSRNYLTEATLSHLDGHTMIRNDFEPELYEAQIKRALKKWKLIL